MINRYVSAGFVLAFFLLSFAETASGQVPTDYLVQMVCVDGADVPQQGDPAICNAKRKLRVGEALPYHKVDYLGYQISDSFPIADLSGISRAVQTYYYTDASVSIPRNSPPGPVTGLGSVVNASSPLATFFGGRFRDSRFGNMVHFNPADGGYNIIGADMFDVFFRGTYDLSGGWQPWWTGDCQAAGWLLFPNNTSALSYGGKNAPTDTFAACPGQVPVAASTVEWNRNKLQTYASGKTLDSLIAFFYAPGHGAIEVSYFTKEYGVTRFEAWRRGSGQTPGAIKEQCPNSAYDAMLHGAAFYLADCRDWSTIIYPPQAWKPHGTQEGSNILIWPVDPLYTSVNRLQNTYIGGPYQVNGTASCSTDHWQRLNTPAVVNWIYDPRTTVDHPSPGYANPFTVKGKCALRFSTPSAQGGQRIFQDQPLMDAPGVNYTMGGLFWAPFSAGSPFPQVTISVEQFDASNVVIGTDSMTMTLTRDPAAFSKTFTIRNGTRAIRYNVFPVTPNTDFEMTGNWVARRPTS